MKSRNQAREAGRYDVCRTYPVLFDHRVFAG